VAERRREGKSFAAQRVELEAQQASAARQLQVNSSNS
jgi:hypothetical protein